MSRSRPHLVSSQDYVFSQVGSTLSDFSRAVSAASRDTISRWLVSVIRTAGPEALTPGRSPRAQDTRSVSSSWALFNEVFLFKIFARQLFGSLLVPLLLCISKMYPLARMLSRSLL